MDPVSYGKALAAGRKIDQSVNKAAVTTNRIFTDETERDAYFVANPAELSKGVFIKVGAGYQQRINGVWGDANPIIAEFLIDDNTTSSEKAWSSAKVNNLWNQITAAPQWTAITLQNGWGGTIHYAKNVMGIKMVKISTSPGTKNSMTLIGTLPEGYRPSAQMVIPLQRVDDGSTGSAMNDSLIVHTDGRIRVPSDAIGFSMGTYEGVSIYI